MQNRGHRRRDSTGKDSVILPDAMEDGNVLHETLPSIPHPESLPPAKELDSQLPGIVSTNIGSIETVHEDSEEIAEFRKKANAVLDLQSRVDDWKGHVLENFGELLLWGEHDIWRDIAGKETKRRVGIISANLQT
jgi:hypothetical protein